MTLTNTQRDILTAAAQHAERLACPPRRLPTGARQSVAKALMRQGLVIASENPTSEAAAGWTVDGVSVVLVISQQGVDAIGAGLTEVLATESAAGLSQAAECSGGLGGGTTISDVSVPRLSLRSAARTLLTAWDACPTEDTINNPISRAVEAFRAASQPRQSRLTRAPGTPRPGTKQAAVLALLRGPEGTTIAQVMEATGWQQHTVRGFFAGLKKRQDITVTVLERVRQVGPGAQGSRGSHSIYTLAA